MELAWFIDELTDEKAPEAADNPSLYAACQKDMIVVKTLVDDIQSKRQGFLSFGKQFRSAQEAKAKFKDKEDPAEKIAAEGVDLVDEQTARQDAVPANKRRARRASQRANSSILPHLHR